MMYGERNLIFHGGFDENIFTTDHKLYLLKLTTTIVASSVAILSISLINRYGLWVYSRPCERTITSWESSSKGNFFDKLALDIRTSSSILKKVPVLFF